MATENTTRAVLGAMAMVAVDLRTAFKDPEMGGMLRSVWHRALGAIPDDILTAACDLAVQRHRERSATPAHVLDCVDELIGRRSAFPTVGELWEDIRAGYAAWGYHAAQDHIGGWVPKHGEATQRAAQLLGGWACIDRMIEDGQSSAVNKALVDRYRDIREMAGASIALPASAQKAIGADIKAIVGKIGEIEQ